MTRGRISIAIGFLSILMSSCAGWDPTWSEDVSEAPIAPKTGFVVDVSHTARWSITYFVQLEVDRRSAPTYHLDVALSIKSGNENVVIQPCAGHPMITDRIVRQCIGAFKATSGKPYVVSARVKTGVPGQEANLMKLRVGAANSLIEPRT